MPHKDPEAKKAYMRERYKLKAEEIKAYQKEYRKLHSEEISKRRAGYQRVVYLTNVVALRMALIHRRGGMCVRCGEQNFSVLDFHHRDPFTKSFNIGSHSRGSHTREEMITEADKCDLLCGNCHVKEHISVTEEEMQKYVLPIAESFDEPEIQKKLIKFITNQFSSSEIQNYNLLIPLAEKDFIKTKYEEGLSGSEIAKIYGVQSGVIYDFMKRNNIPIRSMKETLTIQKELILEKRLKTGRKHCTLCKEEKLMEEFWKMSASFDGRHPTCKSCLKEKQTLAEKYFSEEEFSQMKDESSESIKLPSNDLG